MGYSCEIDNMGDLCAAMCDNILPEPKKKEELKNFYFTFGRDREMPYQGGWIVVQAKDEHTARLIYRMYYPDQHEGTLNCAFIYPEEEFMETEMNETGNLGSYCHAVIGITKKTSRRRK